MGIEKLMTHFQPSPSASLPLSRLRERERQAVIDTRFYVLNIVHIICLETLETS